VGFAALRGCAQVERIARIGSGMAIAGEHLRL